MYKKFTYKFTYNFTYKFASQSTVSVNVTLISYDIYFLFIYIFYEYI